MEEEKKDEPVSVKGEITSLSPRFWNEGWGFGELRPASGKKLKIVGPLEGFRIGMHVSIVGNYLETDKHGLQLKVETIVMDDPSDMRGVRQWIIDRIPQIGPKRADIIAKRWGDKLWEVVENTPHDLLEVDGITPGRVTEIVRAWNEHKKDRELYVPYYELGMTHREAHAAAKAEITAGQVKVDPFALYLGVSGISFVRNDYIASKANAARTAPSRLVAAVMQVIRDAAVDGHTGVTQDYAEEHAAALAGVQWRFAQEGLKMAELNGFVVSEMGLIMLPNYADAERGIAAKINNLLEAVDERGDHPGPDPGGSSRHDPAPPDGDRDGRPGDGQDDHPSDRPGPDDEPLEGGAVRSDW